MTLALPSIRAALMPGQWVRNALWRSARAVPSLDLRFAEQKSLADAVTGQSLVTFTRASSGTYVGSDGLIKTATTNEPRFDHNPTTGESLGLLVEEARTNLLLRSEEFDNASWDLAAGTRSANAAVSPSGAQTADKLIAATSPGTSGQLFQGVAITSGETVTGSLFVKDGGFDRLEIVLLSNNNTTPYGRATFNPIAGTITTAATTANGGTNASASVVPYSNGWYRLIVTVTYPAVTAAGMRILSFNSDGAVGDGVKGVNLWGAQLEAGAFPTSYIPTTTATVTRSADVASITGANFSSWYRQDEGTVFADVQRSTLIASTQFSNLWSTSDNTANERFIVYNTGLSQTIDAAVTDGGVSQASLVALGAITANNSIKTVLAYRANDFALTRNAGIVQSDTIGTLPTVDRIYIGANSTGAGQWTGTIGRLVFWPQRLPNSTLEAITR